MNLPFTDSYILKRYGKTLPSPNPKTFSVSVSPLVFLHEKTRRALFLPAYTVPMLLKYVSSLLLLLAVNVSVYCLICLASSFVLSFPASYVKHGHTLFG